MTELGTLTIDGETGALWTATGASAIAAAAVRLPDGTTIVSDVTNPARVLSWRVADPPSTAGLGALYGVGQQRQAVELRIADGVPGALDGPAMLSEPWARLLLIAGMRRWYPANLHVAHLKIDEALAWFDAGVPERAARHLSSQSTRLIMLAQQVIDDDLPGPAAAIVRAAVRAATMVLPSGDPDLTDLRALHEDLEAAEILAELELDPRHDLGSSATLRDLVLTESTGGALTVSGESFDPAGLSSLRALQWTSPGEPNILVIADDATLNVSVNLAPGSAPTASDVRSLLAVAALRVDGAVWSSAPMRPSPDGRSVLATLPLHGVSPDQLTVGVYDPAAGDRPRMDRVGRGFATACRLVVDAWALGRYARTAAISDDDRRQSLARAITAVDTAGELLHELAMNTADEDRLLARERFDVAGTLQDQLEDGVTSAGTEPLLAELVLGDD